MRRLRRGEDISCGALEAFDKVFATYVVKLHHGYGNNDGGNDGDVSSVEASVCEFLVDELEGDVCETEYILSDSDDDSGTFDVQRFLILIKTPL